MAKFKVEDPSGLENLIKVVPQSTTPKYTGAVAKPGEDLTQYDQGLTMFDTPESRRELNYQNQTGWQAWGNALGQSLAEVTAGTLEGFGYLLDLEQHVKALAGTEKEFDNEFSKAMRQFKESVREEAPVFTDPNKPFDPLNSRWWASNLPSIVSTLTLMIPTGAAAGVASKVGRGIGKVAGIASKVARVESGLARGLGAVSEFLSADTKMLGGLTSTRAITSGAISRVLESTMEAAGNADQVYKELIAQGKSEEEARTEAGKVASNTYYANLPLMLSDMFEYSVLFRNKGVDNAVDALNKQTKKSLLKNSLAVGGSFLSEGLEEGYQYGVGQEAKSSNNASETMGKVMSNFGEYFDDPEFLSSVVVGGMSGAGFQALGNVIESRSAKLANIFPEFDDTALQGLVASTGKSASALKTSAQAAFTKFKGNLSDALADIESTIANLPADVKDTTREAYRLGLQTLKEAGKITDEALQKIEPETYSDKLWNGAKEKINTAISRIKKWSGINEEIQKLEAAGNTPQAEILKKSEFVKLLEINTADAEKFMAQAKEEGFDTTEYEDIYKTYKEAYIQHKGNPDAAKAEVQAKIRRQEKNTLQTEIMKAGVEYGDFDFNALRDQYLDREGSPEAKLLRSDAEPNNKVNKTVINSLKEKVKQLVELELEELRLTKEADKLDTKVGQEELAARKKEEKIAEIKQSSDPEILYEAYKGEDEEVSKLAKSRIDNLIKEEFDILPDPRFFETADKFKDSLSTKDFPMLGLAKSDPAIDTLLTDFWNKNTLASERPMIETFEDSEFEKVTKLLLERDSQTQEEHYDEFEARTFIDPEIEALRKEEIDRISDKTLEPLKPFVQYLNSIDIELGKKYKASDVVEKLKPLLEKNNIAKEAFNAIQTQLEKLGSPIVFLNNDLERNDKSRAGIYRGMSHTTEIFLNTTFDNYRGVTSDKISERVVFNVLHELIHSLTNYKLYIAEHSNEKSSLLTNTDKETISKLNQLFEFLKGRKELKDEYGVTDVYELITETLSKPTFIAKLKKIKVDNKYFDSGKNIFEHLIDLITRLFSGHKGGSAFEASTSLISKLIENADVAQLNIMNSKFSFGNDASEIQKIHKKYDELSYEKFKALKGVVEPELETELGDWKGLNDQIQENLELTGDFMLHSQLWSMSKGASGLWWDRQFNKVTQKDIDEGKFPQDQLGNNKYNSTNYNDWTDDQIATEELFNNFGDPKDYEVYFEVQPKEWTDWKTKKKVTTTIANHWIRVFVMKDGKKVYIGQLQDTEKTKNNELTNTPALQALREVAEEELKTLKLGEKKVIGKTRIVNYSPGLYNNLAKPRDVKAALTDEELENVGIGVYMGDHEPLGKMRTNRPLIRNIKPVNAKPGSVYVAKKTPTGDYQWFACITKNLREMPELVQKVRDLLAPFESTDPLELQLATREEKVRTTLVQLREIVRYKVGDKYEPGFGTNILNITAYHDENGKFSVDKFIEKHNLLDRKVQIDPKRLEDDDYVKDVVLDRLITDIDRIPFVNPFITVAPPDSKVLTEPVIPVQEETILQDSEKQKEYIKYEQLVKLPNNKLDLDKVLEFRRKYDYLNTSQMRAQSESSKSNIFSDFAHAVEKTETLEIVKNRTDIDEVKRQEYYNKVWNELVDIYTRELQSAIKYYKTMNLYDEYYYKTYDLIDDLGILIKKGGSEVVSNFNKPSSSGVKLKVSTKKKTFLLRTTQKPELYKGQIDVEKAVRELKRIVPNGYTVNVLKSLIESEGVSAYGMVHDAAITLSEKAPYGTEYHEAWHAIEQVLPKFQYDRIKNYLTEEERADLFAEYEMTNQAPSILKRIFQLVKAFLQDLINYHPSLLDLFERANAGYYKNKKIGRYGTFYKIDGLTERNKQDLVNVYLAEVGEFYDLSKRETIETLIDSNPQQNGLTFIGEESPLVSFIAKVAEVKGLDEANKLLAYIRPDVQVNEEGEFVSDGNPRMGILYPELLKSLGKRGYKIVLGKTELQTTLGEERELEDGETFEEPETDTLEGWQESASLRSPIEKLSKRMKQLIYSVRSDKQDSLGLGMNLTYNGYEAYSRLAAVIVDSIDVADMMEKISSRKDKFFQNLLSYIDEKFDNPINVYTELYKALGDKTQPEFWVTQEKYDKNGEIEILVYEANRASIKKRVENILGDYQGTSGEELMNLLDMQDVRIDYKDISTALKTPGQKERMLAVWKLIGSKIYSKFISSHLSVDGKKTYEIINGGYFSKLTQRLQRDFEGIKAELFNKDPFLKELPILQTKPKAGDFQFVIYAGYKDADGNGLMYNNYTEKEFVTSTFRAWMGKEKIHMMPILSDSPNLIGVRYRIPEGDREEMIAKIIHLEHNRSKDTHGIKNYNPDVRIFEQIPYKESMNEQILEVQKYFDAAETEYKEYAKQVGAQIQYKSNDNPNLVRSYLLEHAIVHSQMSMLSVGHLSFYKNLEDYYKRAKEIWSPVIKGNVDNYFMDGDTKIEVFSKWQRLNVLPTVESPSSQAAELESIGFNDYKKVDKTDAQTYIDLISYRDRMITLNEWTPKHQKAFTEFAQGQLPSEDIVGLFNVLKPFYFNQHVVDGNLVSPVQKKDSELLILPIYGLETINGQPNRLYNPLWKSHLEMMGYNFDTMSYDEQGRKEGKYYDIITYDTTMKVGMRSEISIDLAKWGKQQETPEHHYMSDAIFGTQIMKLITGNLEGTYNVDGIEITAKELWQEYNKLVSEWTIDNFNKVVSEYGSEEKLKRMIIEEMINKGMRDDYIRSIQQLPLTHPIHFNKVIQIINSFAKNKITDITFDKGYTFANASSEGFSNELKIKWNNNDPKLGIDHFEVYAPIHDPRIKNYLEDGVVNMEKLQLDIDRGYIPDLLTGLVYRIPTEGKYSMFKIKIVGFLPVDNGVMFMPDMVTKIAGLDFDIDKVRGFFFGGNKLQDRVLSLMTAVLSSPASLKEQLTPGGFDNLKNNNLLIRAYKAGINPEGKSNKELEGLLKDKLPFFSPITLSKIAKRMNTGKALIGVAANVNAVHSLMEAYSTFDVSSYNDYLDVVYNGENLDTLSRKYDTDGNLISANIAELLAAFVDNGKDPQAEYSNITSDTIGVALYLLKKGVPLKAVQFFMTQVNPNKLALGTSGNFGNFSLDKLERDLKKKDRTESEDRVLDYDALFRSLEKGAKRFESYVAGVKVANAGAGATMVDNYLKIKKYKKAVEVNTSVIDDPGLTKTLIEKGLLEWNEFIVDKFKVPDVNKGTIVKALDLMTEHVLEYVTDKDVKDLYNSFITFVSSGYFKYDKTIVQDMGNADTLLKHKLANPTNKFLNRLEIKDGFLQFIGANTNDELEIQSIIDNWEELINSTDADTKKFGNDLIKYAFYQRGFDFGVGSFGHLIPVSYFIKNTEFSKYYVDTMRSLDQSNQEKANAFVEQFVTNNYKDIKIPVVKGRVDGELLYIDNPPSVDGKYAARYVKLLSPVDTPDKNGNLVRTTETFVYKYMGDGVYHQLGTRGKYVGTNKYLQWYDFNAKAKEFNAVPSEKKYVTQSIDVVANALEKLEVESQVLTNSTDKTVVVPEGSSKNNLPIFTTDDSIFLMNDQQQAAHDEIFKFINEKLDDRSTDQTKLKISKLGSGTIPKGVYDNSIGLLGKGGTGKTSMLKVLINNIIEEKSKGYNRVSVRYIAPTHTAATMLQEALGFDSERTGEGVSTFASFVGRNQLKGSPDGIPENSDLLLVKDEIWLKQIELGQVNPVSSADIIVIDESSMISNTMLQNFMQRFNIEGGSQLPIFIFMGDYRQLPPVEETKEKFSEGVVSATIFANPEKYVELTQVMRSKDKELHRIYDSVGQQITQQRNQILNGQTPDKFDWKKYDDVTSKSTSNILITQERQVDQVIEDYTKQLVDQDNPYHIFWTHYNKLNHQRTQVLFNKIRNTYFKQLGVTDVKPGVMVNDYVQYTQSLPLPTLNGKYGDINISSGELKPGSRYKVKDLRKEAVNVSDISDTLLDYFGGVTMNMDKIYLVNRTDKLRYTMLFEKGAITAGTYNKETKTIPVTIRTSDGVSLTKEVAYRDFFSLKSYVASARKGIDGIFEPSYIGSTHTVQGASIKTIIVGDYNIRQNQGSVDMRDIESSLYTALTRSAGKLVIIKPNVVPIENNQEVFSYTLRTPDSLVPSQEKVMQPMTFEEEQSSGYRERTIKNASADATIALASDFTTAGERLTKNSVEGQKKKYIPIDTKNLTVTPERVAGIVSRLNSVNAKTLNIAGNGIYSLPYTQEQVDEFTYQLLKAVLESPDLKNKIESIRSGGQTGFDEAGVKAGRRLGIPTLVLAPKGWKFRNKQGQDISNEQQFKARFDVQVPTQMTMFDIITFTQEMVDTINENVKKAGYPVVYTIEELNAMPEDRKKKAIDCYGKN